MPLAMEQKLLRALDRLVDMGDRRAAAVQLREVFRSVRVTSQRHHVFCRVQADRLEQLGELTG